MVSFPMEDREFNQMVARSRMFTGMSSEALCIADCYSRGYVVSKPFDGVQKYDLIVHNGVKLLRLQVKTISQSGQIPIGYTKYTEDTYGKGLQERVLAKYDGSEFDFLAAVDRNSK